MFVDCQKVEIPKRETKNRPNYKKLYYSLLVTGLLTWGLTALE